MLRLFKQTLRVAKLGESAYERHCCREAAIKRTTKKIETLVTKVDILTKKNEIALFYIIMTVSQREKCFAWNIKNRKNMKRKYDKQTKSVT